MYSLSLRIVFLAAVSIYGQSLWANTFRVDPATSELEFTAVGKPGFLRINGKEGKLSGSVVVSATRKLSATLESALDDFKTGIDLRDEHMKKKHLETEKYPKAVLTLDSLPIDPSLEQDVPFDGKLLFHGVERPVSGKAKLTPKDGGKTVEVEAEFSIKLSDFKVDIPHYLGVTVAEDVEVRVSFAAIHTSDATH